MNNIIRTYEALEDLVDEIVDNRGKSVPTSNSGIPLIATNCIKHSSIFPTYENIRFVSKDIYDSWFRSYLKPNDILFVNKGTPGRVCVVPNPVQFCAAQDMVGLRFKNSVDYRYMLAILRSNEIQKTIANNHVGLVIPHLRKKELLKLKLPIIDISIQRKIGKLYFDISNKIELNNKINAELESMAKLIYDYWFVQFDFPNEQGKPYKSSGGKMVWNEELKREVPEGWEVKGLGELTSILVRGVSPKYIQENGIPVINQRCIRNKMIDFSFARNHDNKSKKVESKLVQIGDVLVNSTGVGTLGRVAIVKRLEAEKVTADSHVTIIRIDSKKANPCFLGYSISERQTEIEQLGEGSTGQTELSRDNLGKLNLLIPSVEIQLNFERILKPIFYKMANNEKQNQELASLRDWLLPMLMNGQVSVGEVEENLAMVAEEMGEV